MDIQKIPPIQQKRIVTFVNHFIVDTVSFLNKFINSSETMLWKLEKRMRKLETSLKLLEVKLNFVPEHHSTDVPVSQPTTEEASNNPTEPVQLENEVAETSPKDHSTEQSTSDVPEELQKYYKMVHVGVPVQAVKLKMKRDGLDPNLLV